MPPSPSSTGQREKALPLVEQGAVWRDSVAELAASSDVVTTIVGFPNDVEEIYFGEGGIINNARPGSYIVDMTTSKPSLARKIYEAARQKRLHALDAPVTGGDIGARNGTLTIMVGGDREAFEVLIPLFQTMGKTIVLQGPAGSGQHTKMCNQIAIASNIMGVCESLAYAGKAGLDMESVVSCLLSGGAASWQMSAYAPRIMKNNWEPGFYVKHFVKDMSIAIEEAESMGLDTPALKLSKALYDRLVKDGKEDLGTHALYQSYSG